MQYLFDPDIPFMKANLHCHTTRSDGHRSPEEVRDFYRSQGYDILALTDHRVVSEQPYVDRDMLFLPGVEMDFAMDDQVVHIVGVGVDEGYADDNGLSGGPQTCVDAMRAHGGRAILCHPAWSLNTTDTICSFRGLTAAEIYNSTSTYPWNGDRADASVSLDIAFAHGARFGVVASDDSHSYTGEAGRSATMIQAKEPSWQSVREALDAGRFYATQGPRFEQIILDAGMLKVYCSPVKYVIFYSNLVWADSRCQTGKDLTHARYSLTTRVGERFVRVQIIDEQGKSAWSNPISLE